MEYTFLEVDEKWQLPEPQRVRRSLQPRLHSTQSSYRSKFEIKEFLELVEIAKPRIIYTQNLSSKGQQILKTSSPLAVAISLSKISIGFPAESPTKTRKALMEIMFTDGYGRK